MAHIFCHSSSRKGRFPGNLHASVGSNFSRSLFNSLPILRNISKDDYLLCFSSSISSVNEPLYPHFSHTYCSGKSQRSNLLDKCMFGLPHFGQYLFVGFLRFRLLSISRKVRSLSKLCSPWLIEVLCFVLENLVE